MTSWFSPLFPDAKSECDLISLYSLFTPIGTWQIKTPVRTFSFGARRYPIRFSVAFDNEDSRTPYDSIYWAIAAINGHDTGFKTWDRAGLSVSDFLMMWHREVPKRAVFNYVARWVDEHPEGTTHEMLRWFESDETHLLDRYTIRDYLVEMILTGQLQRFPLVSRPLDPALRQVVRMAKKFGLNPKAA